MVNFAGQLRPTLAAAPDNPPAPPETSGHTWLQRMVRLTHIDTIITILRDHHSGPGDADLDGMPTAPFGQALAATSVALGEIRHTTAVLEDLWARHTTDIDTWDHEHLPRSVRAHVLALEGLVG
ncbi:hypothetical protein ACFVQ4_32905 [Streptomyces laurentii]|uniref:hypothetical protein n=1 Tax=Streptomyces laurentii TaxID=39478 RepID=UPI0036C87813